mgnify:CR=1 FL=1
MYGMEAYSEDGYKVFTTNGKIYYTLLGKFVAKTLQRDALVDAPPPGMNTWYIILPDYIIDNPDKYLTVLKINNTPVKLLNNFFSVAHNPPTPAQLEFFSYTAPEVYVYTRETIQEQADYGLSTFNELGELEFSAVRGNQVLQIEAAYHTEMTMISGTNWTSGVVGNGVLINSLPIKFEAFGGGGMESTRAIEVEMQLVSAMVKATVTVTTIRREMAANIFNSKLILSIVKLPSWTVPTLTW